MARPVWHEAGNDIDAVAALLEKASEGAADLAFDARPAPRDADGKVLHQAALMVARRRLTERHGEKDRVLVQEVGAVDDLVRSANLLVERLREWYALHAPEAVRAEPDAGNLASLVAEHGDRTHVLAALDRAAEAERSLGTDLDDADLAVLRGFAAALTSIHGSWRAIESRIESLMREVAPNLTSVTGPMVGARLVHQAGSLQRLAAMPAGTVQTLGAETALFRHLKEGRDPPKHGILFQHPDVHRAPPWQRGAVARAYARHAGLAARADSFTGNDIRGHLAPSLSKDLKRAGQRGKPKPKPRGRAPPGGQPSPRRGAAAKRSGPGGPRGKGAKPGRSGRGGKPGMTGKKRRGPPRSDGPAKPPGGRRK